MKKTILTLFVASSFVAMSQVADSVELGAAYANESYYSFENGEVANVDNHNWDLAFDLSSFGAAVRLNRKEAIVYVYPGSNADWSSLDTAGMANNWDQLINGYNDWSEGALNAAADPNDATDLGWGLYNTTTHAINGERLFVLKFNDDTYKKIYIESLIGGAYILKSADLDNSNEISQSIDKANYTGKNFVYYAVKTNTIVDREPISASWDLVFTNYIKELAPGYFGGLTGALHNLNTGTSEASGMPVADLSYGTFSPEIETIGYDWKTFDMSTFSYTIEDSLAYFIETQVGDIWKLVFTGFRGTSNGRIVFSKEKIATASINENEAAEFDMFPNPANSVVSIVGSGLDQIIIQNGNGQIVYQSETSMNTTNTTIPVDRFENGIYFVKVYHIYNQMSIQKLIVNH